MSRPNDRRMLLAALACIAALLVLFLTVAYRATLLGMEGLYYAAAHEFRNMEEERARRQTPEYLSLCRTDAALLLDAHEPALRRAAGALLRDSALLPDKLYATDDPLPAGLTADARAAMSALAEAGCSTFTRETGDEGASAVRLNFFRQEGDFFLFFIPDGDAEAFGLTAWDDRFSPLDAPGWYVLVPY